MLLHSEIETMIAITYEESQQNVRQAQLDCFGMGRRNEELLSYLYFVVSLVAIEYFLLKGGLPVHMKKQLEFLFLLLSILRNCKNI